MSFRVMIDFDSYFYHLRTRSWKKHLLKHSFTKQFCPWTDQLILLLHLFLELPIHINYNNSTIMIKIPVLPNSEPWKYVENLSVLSVPFLEFLCKLHLDCWEKSIFGFCRNIWITKLNQKSNEKKNRCYNHMHGRGGEGSEGNMRYCALNLFYIFYYTNYILVKQDHPNIDFQLN